MIQVLLEVRIATQGIAAELAALRADAAQMNELDTLYNGVLQACRRV